MGTLYVVATPLGNLEDFSSRAARILGKVSCIACEDTRRTARLLARLEIDTPTISCHRFNEQARLESLLARIRSGEDVAIVSDGGTPVISDPGSRLVRAVLDEGLTVCPIPGPSAVSAILSVCGLSADRFVFEGFLPPRAGERRRRLRELIPESRPVVLFEAPHRIRATLADLQQILGGRRLVLGRELTKLHESILAGSAAEIAGKLSDEPRGEITLVLEGAIEGEELKSTDEHAERVLEAWHEDLRDETHDRRIALKRVARKLGLRRAELYRLLTELGEKP